MNLIRISSIALMLLVRLIISQIGAVAYAQAPSSYRLTKQTIGAVAQQSMSASYQLKGTLGQPSAIGRTTTTNYRLGWGYWTESNYLICLPLILK